MDDLPFLVVHGALIAKLMIVGLAAVLLGALELVRRQRERARTRFDVGWRADALTTLAPGYASVSGRLHGHAATLMGGSDTPLDAAHSRSDALEVEVDGERMSLIGDVQVIRGTRAAAAWRRLPSGTPAGLASSDVRGRRRLFSVADGDEVVVQGMVVRGADPAGAPEVGYREPAGSWQMRPMSNLPAIELVAVHPVTVPVARGPIRLAVWAAAALATSYGALHEIGKLMVEERTRDAPAFGVRAQLAAAWPGARDEAISDMWWQLRNAPRSATSDAQRLALSELRTGCAGRADWLFDHERYEEIVADMARCTPDAAIASSPKVDAQIAAAEALDAQIGALAQLGRYREAADRLAQHPGALHDKPRERVEIAVGAGRWADAAVAADQAAQRLATELRPNDSYAELQRRRISGTECMAEWFRAKAGDPAAGDRLARRAITDPAPTCGLTAALLLPEAQRPAALAEVQAVDRYGDAGQLARALQWVATGDDDSLLLALRYQAYSVDPWTWLAPLAIDDPRDPPERRDAVHTRRALHAMLAGSIESALAEANAVAGGRREWILAVVELHTAKTEIAWHGQGYSAEDMTRSVALRGGTLQPARHMYGECDDVINGALRTAVAGDGQAMANVIAASCDDRPGVVELALAVAPRITAHRGELADAMGRFAGRPYTRDELPFSAINDAAFRRDVQRLLGDAAGAERWQAQITAQLAMLADRDKLIGLLMWEQ